MRARWLVEEAVKLPRMRDSRTGDAARLRGAPAPGDAATTADQGLISDPATAVEEARSALNGFGEDPPPFTGVPFLLGGIGLAAFIMGFILAVGGHDIFKQLAGLISLVIGAVLITGGFIVAAITHVRVDLWRERRSRLG